MVLETVYRLGDMLGIEHRDMQNLLSDRPIININPTTPFSPMNTYKNNGTLYGTISINDF